MDVEIMKTKPLAVGFWGIFRSSIFNTIITLCILHVNCIKCVAFKYCSYLRWPEWILKRVSIHCYIWHYRTRECLSVHPSCSSLLCLKTNLKTPYLRNYSDGSSAILLWLILFRCRTVLTVHSSVIILHHWLQYWEKSWDWEHH